MNTDFRGEHIYEVKLPGKLQQIIKHVILASSSHWPGYSFLIGLYDMTVKRGIIQC